MDEEIVSVLKGEENIVGKGENAGHQIGIEKRYLLKEVENSVEKEENAGHRHFILSRNIFKSHLQDLAVIEFCLEVDCFCTILT